ncbi:hypothetical protein SKAU_G00335660 [Synaphobranchus kaupii]|uniref:Uncharacterized protein n=1 Tax=Synaphobranchus kaupii TaxID=118154 RepID=A0A9Q1EM59_SYNKA|nr:hypothetical protein SKAU_G00335660 [Synaphobranchus kaupii]
MKALRDLGARVPLAEDPEAGPSRQEEGVVEGAGMEEQTVNTSGRRTTFSWNWVQSGGALGASIPACAALRCCSIPSDASRIIWEDSLKRLSASSLQHLLVQPLPVVHMGLLEYVQQEGESGVVGAYVTRYVIFHQVED